MKKELRNGTRGVKEEEPEVVPTFLARGSRPTVLPCYSQEESPEANSAEKTKGEETDRQRPDLSVGVALALQVRDLSNTL